MLTGLRQSPRLVVAACAVLICAWPARPQVAASPEAAASAIHLALRLTVPVTRFHQGELIPLELSYTSDVPKRYQISTTLQHFCGNDPPVRFVLSPSGRAHDPEKLYWASSGGGCAGDILSGIGLLSRTPVKVPAFLNDLIAIDRAGAYRLYAVSQQVGDVGRGEAQPVPLEIRSNEIRFEIVPADPAWQRAQLDRIREVLDHTPAADGAAPGTPRAEAIHALRFLSSEDAAREMARRLRGGEPYSDFQCELGLIDSPQRAAALAEMTKLFEDPSFPVSGGFLDTLALVSLDPKTSATELFSLRNAKESALGEQLADILPSKRGEALAVSLDTALEANASLSPAAQSALVEQILPSFVAFPVDMQITWLQGHWTKVKGAMWVPVLRAVATRYEDFPEPREGHAWQSLQASGAALEDWYELDPESAREAVMTEIRRPKPRYDASVLGLLPDETLPEVEETLAENFVAADNYEIEANLASLLLRYADGSVLPVVLPKIEEKVGTWACNPQDKILAFALKTDPETAKPLIQRAVAARGPESNACRHGVLTDVAQGQPTPSLEEIALPALDDTDPQVAINAAEYLGEYGSAAAEQPLWEHYESWSRQWSGRADELRVVPGSDNPNSWETARGQALARALANGIAWLADANALRRISTLDVTSDLKPEFDNDEAALQQRPMVIVASGSHPVSFQLAQYSMRSLDELKTKLAEFPRGTAFTWSSDMSPEQEAVFKEVSAFARQRGLVINAAASN